MEEILGQVNAINANLSKVQNEVDQIHKEVRDNQDWLAEQLNDIKSDIALVLEKLNSR